MTQICISKLGHHSFPQRLVACLARSHYLNKCWIIVNMKLGSKFQWNLNQNTQIVIHKKMLSAKCQPFCLGLNVLNACLEYMWDWDENFIITVLKSVPAPSGAKSLTDMVQITKSLCIFSSKFIWLSIIFSRQNFHSKWLTRSCEKWQHFNS